MSETVFQPVGCEYNVSRLSEGQQACLRLVAQYHSSKEVARALGVSPHTVDQRLKRAIAILGVTTRAEAARIFMASESGRRVAQQDHDLVYQCPDLSVPSEPVRVALPVEGSLPSSGVAVESLREPQSAFFASGHGKASSPSWLDIGWNVGRVNRLSTSLRTMLIFACGVVSVLVMGILVSIAEGLSRLSP